MTRRGCSGIIPLTGRLEPWQRELCNQPERLADLIAEHGSPLNVLNTGPLARNTRELQDAAAAYGIELAVSLARKANKALSFVHEAKRLGLGVDVASERELQQALERGIPAQLVVVTAAVKPRTLLKLCVASGATVVIDNADELALLAQLAAVSQRRTPVAFRLAPRLPGRPPSRFGLDHEQILALAEHHWPAPDQETLELTGVHFHLDGYDADERIAAIGQSVELVDTLRVLGHRPAFVDIGGGIPMSYLDDAEEWEYFWQEHRSAVLGEREPLTFEGHGLGLMAHAGQIVGRPNVYPYYQHPTRGDWLRHVLARTATAITERGLELRCEPGRALLDGCGLTAARVEFRKQRTDGAWLIGVAMNRTQCRSTSDDFLIDPLLVRPGSPLGQSPSRPIDGYLVGAYCIERELLTWRRLRFPHGVEVGDIVIFPNTAGYMMHILESASHQIPLARNVVISADGRVEIDPIDADQTQYDSGTPRADAPASRAGFPASRRQGSNRR